MVVKSLKRGTSSYIFFTLGVLSAVTFCAALGTYQNPNGYSADLKCIHFKLAYKENSEPSKSNKSENLTQFLGSGYTSNLDCNLSWYTHMLELKLYTLTICS